MRYVKKGDIVRVIEKQWGLPKNLITEVIELYPRYDRELRAKVIWVIIKTQRGSERSCPAKDIALASSKGMRFQYNMQGPFIDEDFSS